MKYIFIFLLSQTVLLPIIAGLIRLRRIDRNYQPFYILLWVGFITEIVSLIVMRTYPQAGNAIPVNIYLLLEWTLIAWQFHAWGFLGQRKKAFYTLLGFTTLLWLIINIGFGKIYEFSPYFSFFYCFLIVLLSVNKINYMITHYNRNLFRNTQFLICIGFIIYFLYMIIYYWASNVSMSQKSEHTATFVFFLMAYINALTNIIYTIALLLIPAPQKFTFE